MTSFESLRCIWSVEKQLTCLKCLVSPAHAASLTVLLYELCLQVLRLRGGMYAPSSGRQGMQRMGVEEDDSEEDEDEADLPPLVEKPQNALGWHLSMKDPLTPVLQWRGNPDSAAPISNLEAELQRARQLMSDLLKDSRARAHLPPAESFLIDEQCHEFRCEMEEEEGESGAAAAASSNGAASL
jgi:hypothetical protein